MNIIKQVLLVKESDDDGYIAFKDIPQKTVPSSMVHPSRWPQDWLNLGWTIVSASDKTVLLTKNFYLAP